MFNKNISIIGGDKRSIELIKLISKKNTVKIYGFDKYDKKLDIKESKTLEEAIKESDIIICPLPFHKENKYIYSPFSSEKIEINSLLKLIDKKQILFGGKFNSEFIKECKTKNINIVDYFDREELKILNAIPTTEGAIAIAINNLPITIHNSNTLILGYGRIGKILSKILYSFGANTNVVTRNKSDIAWINANGYNAIDIKNLNENLSNIDIIFNTIPNTILKENQLIKLNKNTLIIDIASYPGGIDFEKAKELDLNVKWALGIPGKVAPTTAGKIIHDTIYNIISEMEDF
ncbi:dipicolinate synthase subunit DpsA [Senegalia massiliensis]|uniref:dipicolinate synthase subunit DpsA n=1 Tax=Senegalia massiliensis TaxID=1720316 RepID=UPI00103074CD|nr:dipicolinate synthase subunit DpsA [Senegalia massiliensis]